jgi:hypothetical protein
MIDRDRPGMAKLYKIGLGLQLQVLWTRLPARTSESTTDSITSPPDTYSPSPGIASSGSGYLLEKSSRYHYLAILCLTMVSLHTHRDRTRNSDRSGCIHTARRPGASSGHADSLDLDVSLLGGVFGKEPTSTSIWILALSSPTAGGGFIYTTAIVPSRFLQ